MNVLVLVVDRLHLGYLGAYGNAWVGTPAFDRLASESFLFDQALSFSSELAPFYQALWQGKYPSAEFLDDKTESTKKSAAGAGYCVMPLVDRFQTGGLHTRLLTDDPAIADLPAAFGNFFGGERDFGVQDDSEGSLLPAPCGLLCETAEETHLAACFSRLVSALTTIKKPFGFWCHLSSLGKIWDAPLRYRARYAEEGDPEPSESDGPVEKWLASNYDPDELLTTTWSYAAGVAMFDECLAALREYLEELNLLNDTALVITSPRSYPLGEHRRVGHCDAASYEELVHVPLLIRLPDGTGAAGRSNALVTPLDLFETLSELVGFSSSQEKTNDKKLPHHRGESLMPILRFEKEQTARDRVLLGFPHGDRAIRTPLWHMRLTDPVELYVKPDDRWEFNNVADRLREEVDALRAVAEQDIASLQTATSLEPLPEILCRPPE